MRLKEQHLGQIQYVDLDQLKPHPDNPRVHPPKQIRQIAKSIQTFGFRFPVLINSDSRLIAGHGRVEACRKLGITRIPALQVTDLTDDQIRALMIADNRLTETSRWNDRLLGENLKILSDQELDFDLDVVGFEYGEIEYRLTQLEAVDGEDSNSAAMYGTRTRSNRFVV